MCRGVPERHRGIRGTVSDPLFEPVEYPFRRCSRSANSFLVFSLFLARSRSLRFRERLAPRKNRELSQRANNDAADWRTALELEAEFCIVHGRDQTKQLLRPRLSSVSFVQAHLFLFLFLPSFRSSSPSVVIVVVVAVFVAPSNVSVISGFRPATAAFVLDLAYGERTGRGIHKCRKSKSSGIKSRAIRRSRLGDRSSRGGTALYQQHLVRYIILRVFAAARNSSSPRTTSFVYMECRLREMPNYHIAFVSLTRKRKIVRTDPRWHLGRAFLPERVSGRLA